MESTFNPDALATFISRANISREALIRNAKICGVRIIEEDSFNGDKNLHAYKSTRFIFSSTIMERTEALIFLGEKNYLMGLADSADSLGYVLCYDSTANSFTLVEKPETL